MAPILGIYASSASPNVYANSYESIATATAAGGETSLSFTSIPSTYQHLQIRAITRDTNTGAAGATSIQARYNSDSGANYTYHYLYGNGSSAGPLGATAGTWYISQGSVTANTTANVFTSLIFDIADYANTSKYKTTRWVSAQNANSTSAAYYIQLNSGLWTSTAAINSIAFYAQTAFAAGTTFALYGIKG